jgi:hypothetical protein
MRALRVDIPEGAHFAQMPRIGFGHVLCAKWLEEHYFTLRFLGWRLFVVHCQPHYELSPWKRDVLDRKKVNQPYWRWWFQRDTT